MPCLILTGHPCSGKSTFAAKLKERALQHPSKLIDSVIILNEESVCVNATKAECYASSQQEKATRSALKAELDRSLSPRTLVILDSMNYIKGYRYELHCSSKAAGERHGVIWILNSVNVIQQWNNKEKRYPEDLLQELIQRYEPPDARNRWDKPLYRVDLTPANASTTTNQAAQDALQRSVYNMHSLSDAITDSAAAGTATAKPKAKSAASSFKKKRPSNRPPNETINGDPKEGPTQDNGAEVSTKSETDMSKQSSNDDVTKTNKNLSLDGRIDEILDSFFLDVQPLKKGASTVQIVLGDSDVLNQVDSLTQKVCNIIAQAPSGRVELLDYGVSLQSARRLALPELKRLRQQYIRWVAQHPPTDASERGLVASFVKYVEGHV